MARALELVGFKEGELIAVTDYPPVVNKDDPDEAFGVVMLSAPFDFRLQDYPLHTNDKGQKERLVPASVLNAFKRAIWPV
jgi:hypothetical protein